MVLVTYFQNLRKVKTLSIRFSSRQRDHMLMVMDVMRPKYILGRRGFFGDFPCVTTLNVSELKIIRVLLYASAAG